LNKNPIQESRAALSVSLYHIAHGVTCVRGIPCSSKYCANPRVFISLNSFHSQFRLHKGFLEHEGALEFDHHFMDVIGISPCDWQLKLQIACDLALALDQCHVRCFVIPASDHLFQRSLVLLLQPLVFLLTLIAPAICMFAGKL
jgi:hypothetical protein